MKKLASKRKYARNSKMRLRN